MIVHKEYSIKILAPNELKRCCMLGCTREGSWAVHIKDDHNNTAAYYDPVCELHVITAILESLTEQF